VANEVKLTLKVDDNGSLSIVASEANKAAGATEKLDRATKKTNKSRKNHQKVEKGVGQLTSNTTKAFSKQAGAISGGLVPAYAVLAANIFAITAAFGALQRAAQVDQLTAGLTALGQASGLAMQTLSKGLVEATGNALSLEEAMRSTALITSAGLDPSSIQRFGEVARNASVALGRDTADSLARLTRGVTKLEPELLDELGIMVRIDEATQDYAAALGKSASELTNFEKRQAFMNAALDEGDRKFKAIGSSVDSNPYDKLAATFQNLAKTLLGIVNTALSPIVSFLASSPTALLGVLVAFAGTVVSKMVPSLSDLEEKALNSAIASEDLAKSQLKSIKGLKGLSPAVATYSKALQNNNVQEGQLESAMSGANKAVVRRSNLVKKTLKGTERQIIFAKALTSGNYDQVKSLLKVETSLNQARKAQDVFIRSNHSLAMSQAEVNAATAVSTLQTGVFTQGLSEAGDVLKAQINSTRTAIASSTALGAVNIFVSGTFTILGTAATFASAAIARIAPILTIISIVAAIILPIFSGLMSLFRDPAVERYEEKSSELAETMKELSVNLKEVDDSFANQSKTLEDGVARYTALSNILDQFMGKYKDLSAAAPTGSFDEQSDALDSLISSSSHLSEKFAEQFDGAKEVSDLIGGSLNRNTREAVSATVEFVEAQLKSATAIKAAGAAIKESAVEFSKFMNASVEATPFDNITAAMLNIQKEMEKADEDAQGFAQIIRGMSSDQVNIFGLQNESDHVRAATEALQHLATTKADLEAELSPFNLISSGARAEIRETIEDVITAEKIMNDELAAQDASIKEQVAARTELFQTQQKSLQLNANEQKVLKSSLDILKETDAVSGQRREKELALEEQIRLKKQQSLVTQVNTQNVVLQSLQSEDDKKAKITEINALLAQITLLEAQKLTKEEKSLEVAKAKVTQLQNEQKGKRALLDFANQEIKASETATKNALKRTELNLKADAARERGGDLDELDNFKLLTKEVEDRGTLETKIVETKQKQAKLDFAMQKATLIAAKAELAVLATKAGVTAETKAALTKDIVALDGAIASVSKGGELYEATITNIANTESNITAEKSEQLARIKESALETIRTQTQNIKILDIQKQLNSELKKAVKLRADADKIQTDISKLENTNMDGSVKSAIEAARIEEEVRQRKIETAMQEHKMLIAGVEIEKSLMKAKFKLLQAEMAKDELSAEEAGVLNATARVLFQQEKNLDQQITNSKQNVGLLKQQVALERSKALINTGRTSGAAAAALQGQGNIRAIEEAGVGGVDDRFKDQAEKDKAAEEAGLALRRSIMEGLASDFSALGPEGEVVGSVIQGSLAVSDAWTTAFERIGENGKDWKANTQEVLGAVGASIGALSNMYAASSRASIANVDKQIAAEKKRDGNSAKSVQKVAALEKKKEAMAKKAFETNKKMQIASTIISTASAVMAVLSEDAKKGLGSLAIPMAVAVGAMGAAQVAMIAKTSFQGGSSSGGAVSAPSAVSLGKRGSSVDVGQRAGSGELAYLRGARGSGTNANDFKPAFYGARMRASGGAVAGYTVGEQGPELFVPEVPGTIVPNDDVGMGQNVNVSFNVQAIDASSFNDALTVQRGNIIEIIREAANSSGEGFLESVDTQSLI